MPENGDVGGVPSWDGAARGWRRYTREVAWYVQSTAPHKRRHCASRLMGKLTGPARLLAMSWSQVGLRHRGRHQATSSTLGCQSLGAEVASQRCGHLPAVLCLLARSARIHGKFLGSRDLGLEALIRLHEEKLGLSQADRDFGLPSTKEELWEDRWRWREDGWDEGWGEQWWGHDNLADADPTTSIAHRR